MSDSRTASLNGSGRYSRGYAAELASRGKHGKARITNGSALLPGVDGRSVWVRRCKDLISEHLVDVGNDASAAERSLIRRACVLTVELEQLEHRFATAGPASADDLDLYQRTAGGLRRLLETVGLKRRPRDVTSSLKDYLGQRSDVIDGEAE